MRSTFGGIETTLRGLRAQQLALDITGHNISNANTPGYSRQVAGLIATDPYAVPTMNRNAIAGQIGTGVEANEICRMRDEFVDRRTQYENASLGYWDARHRNFNQLEVTMAEPTDLEGGASIGSQLNEFWDALQKLGNANRPDNVAVRSVVREKALNLCDTIRSTYNQLKSLQQDLNTEISVRVGRVNSIAQEIAGLNREIAKVVSMGNQPNDLLDHREQLVNELAGLTDISLQSDELNRYTISISGMMLVSKDTAFAIETQVNTDDTDSIPDGMNEVVWAYNGEDVNLSNGELKGLMDMRDTEIPYYLESLDTFTTTLVDKFNTQHALGFGLDGNNGRLFFETGSDASNITLAADILDAVNGLNNIAASRNGQVGNGENALELAGLIKDQSFVALGDASLSDYYGGLIAKLGVDAEKAKVTYKNQKTLINHLQNMQESVAGVSLDEEMANMIRFQNAYNAAARIMTALDEALDKLINGTGLVGR
jgi:flagellar hook-associated protein 1 FlgK